MTSIDPRAYQALVLASALEMWAKHRIRANISYTPLLMIAAASGITGKTFKPRDYLGAAKALREMVKPAKPSYEDQGTAFDPHAVGHERVGRKSE